MKWFFLVARSFVWAVLTLVFHIEYRGTEHIPRGRGGYILVSNHVSYLDPVSIAFSLRPWVRFLAKGELQKGFFGKLLFTALGIVPIDRGTGDLSALDRCAELMEQGHVVGIFPEGTRYPQGQPGKPKSGMALLVKKTGADVLPCAVQIERPLRFRSRIQVQYGPLIPYAALGLDEESPRALRRCTQRVWDEILSMLGGETA